MNPTESSASGAPPILVTGTHRSGTTWVGHMLALSPDAHYVHEPFAPMHERSWMRQPPRVRYFHEPPERPGRYADDLDRIVRLQPPWSAIARRAHRPRDVVRLAQDATRTARARRRGARALLKDPFALLCAEWIAARTDARTVVLVRHPAAFAGSVKRLGWRLDVGWLLAQPELMATHLAAFRDELEQELGRDTDIVDHAALVWRALNSVVAEYERHHPDWCVLRYEDLTHAPAECFRELYARVGLEWSPRVAARVTAWNAAGAGTESDPGSKGTTRRDSRRSIWTWLDRLSPDEIARVRSATADLAGRWYGPEDWPASRPLAGPPATGPSAVEGGTPQRPALDTSTSPGPRS